jgi:hypothetical protein
MRWIAFLFIAAVGVLTPISTAFGQADERASPIFGIKIPREYRDWPVISVAHEAGDNNDLRAVLGNDIAMKAYRKGTLPFPDGAIIARLAWVYTASEKNDKIFGRQQSFVPGPTINVQFMVKDSKKYAATGGWGFAQFKLGKPDPTAKIETCFPCHEPGKAHDYVFTYYAP